MVTVQGLGPHEAARLRQARLMALADSPDSFGADLAEESAWPLAQWQTLLEDEAWGIAVDGERIVGLVNVRPAVDAAEADCWIRGWWVSPQARGRGVSAALLCWVDDTCRGRAWPRQGLGIWCDNAPARSLFPRLGFMQVGGEQRSAAWGNRCFVRLVRTVPAQALDREPR